MLALNALMNGTPTTVYNVGTGKGYSVKKIIEAARQITGKNIRVFEKGRRAGDSAQLVASAEKIRRELGWQPRYTEIEKIIESAWRWHRKEAR